ncbi:MAG: hypothetical protein RR228_00335 [Bacilli bacterium]
MNIVVQNKLKENPRYLKYLRENSSWYKILNRDASSINEMIEEMKDVHHLRVTDKIDNALSTIDIITKIIDITK